MSSAAVTYNFVNGAIGDADQVDQNFTDLVSFLNSHVAHIPETLQLKTGSTSPKFQYGIKTCNLTSGQAGTSTTLTFPAAFATVPRVFAMQQDTFGNPYVIRLGVATTTTVVINVVKPDNSAFSASATLDVAWFAVGT